MASIDLKEAYLQVPVHPDSRRFLRFVSQGNVYQFSALCFGLSTAPQIFSRVMAPVSAILHSWGIHMRWYLDDWLVQSSSRESLLHDLQVVLDLCRELGIVVNPAKSRLVPSRVVQYIGVVIDSQSFRASPSLDRITRLLLTAGEFLSWADPPAGTWLSLLGMLSSLSHLVPGGRLRVRSLQLCFHRSWDRGDQSIRIPWSPDFLRDLRWWLHLPRLSLGVSLAQVSPDLDFWSDASDVGWGAHLGSRSGLSVYQRSRASSHQGGSPTLPVFSGGEECVRLPRQLHGGVVSPQGRGHQVSVSQHSDPWDSALGRNPLDPSVTPVHSGVPECSGGLSLSPSPAPTYRVVPSPGGFSVCQSHVAVPNRLICNIRKSPMFSLFLSLPGSDGDAFLQRWDGLQAYAFPPWSVIPRVLAKLCVSQGTELTLIAPYWPQRAWFPDLLHLSLAPPVALPLRRNLLRLPWSHCLYQDLHRLRLHAWRLSGASRELQVSHPL